MPLNEKFKIGFIFLVAALLLAVLFWWNWLVGGLLLLAGLIYLEMILPNWSLYDSLSITHVKSPSQKQVALSFDDGPSPWTPAILDSLKEEGVKATFFLLGKNIERYPQIARRIQEEGHQIGLHSYSHQKLHLKSLGFIREDFDRMIEVFKKHQIEYEPIFRFPHGYKNIFAMRECRRRAWRVCGWGLGVWDSKNPGVEKIIERSKKLQDGGILLLHDGRGAHEDVDRRQTSEALPRILQHFKEMNFKWVTLT